MHPFHTEDLLLQVVIKVVIQGVFGFHRVGPMRYPICAYVTATTLFLSRPTGWWKRARLASAMLALLVSGSFNAFAGGIDPACLERLEHEAREAWDMERALVENSEWTGHQVMKEEFFNNGRSEVREMIFDWTYCWDKPRGRRLVEYHTESSGSIARVVVNPRYRFAIRRLDGEEAWIVNEARDGARGELWDLNTAETDIKVWADAAYCVYSIPLAEIVWGGTLKLVSAEFTSMGSNPRQVRLEAEYVGDSHRPNAIRRKGNKFWALLDPSNKWLISQAGLTFLDGESHLQLTYQSTDAGIPFPSALTEAETREVRGNKQSRTSSVTYGPPLPPNRSADQYDLAYYGLTEDILGIAPTRARTWFLAANLLLIAGLLCALYIRHRSHMARASGP